MKELRDGRVHARMALVRELFRLEAKEVAASAVADTETEEVAPSEGEQLAEVRRLRP